MSKVRREQREELPQESGHDLQNGKEMKGRWLYVLPLLLYSTLLFFVSGMSQPPAPDFGFDWQDKLQHAGAFFIMAILSYLAASKLFPGRKRSTLLLITFCFTSLYGATDEVHQYFVPERTPDIFDWLADMIGAVLGVIAISQNPFSRKKEKEIR